MCAAEFVREESPSTFRRVAAAMWGKPSDPSIYGSMDLDVTETQRFIERYREKTGVRLTITHVVARAVARAFAENPDLNCKVRFGGRLERRRTVDLFVSVATEKGKDLSGVRVDAAEELSLGELAKAVEREVTSVRSGTDSTYTKSRNLLARTPWWLTAPLLRLTDFATNELHVHLPSQGMPRDPFGTVVLTNVGPFGIDTAFAPFLPLGRCAMLLLMSEIQLRPTVVDGAVVARPILRLCATFDHRIVDGAGAGRLAKIIRQWVEDPENAEKKA